MILVIISYLELIYPVHLGEQVAERDHQVEVMYHTADLLHLILLEFYQNLNPHQIHHFQNLPHLDHCHFHHKNHEYGQKS